MSIRVNKKTNFTESGIANASKDNMRDFLMAVLVDNDKQQRMNGLQDQDIAEIYEQSIEIMGLNEEVSLVALIVRMCVARKEDNFS